LQCSNALGKMVNMEKLNTRYLADKLRKKESEQDKKDRLAKALRDNLRRRKIVPSSASKENMDGENYCFLSSPYIKAFFLKIKKRTSA
jgi:hypothetical protein